MKKVEIWTDGACHVGTDNAGGFGIILRYGEVNKFIYGGKIPTTNNQMELLAVIVAIEQLKEPVDVTIYSDSKYVCNGCSSWVYGWKNNGWKKKSSGDPILNQELWERYVESASKHNHKITFHWVKGHNGHPENEVCDTMAVAASDKVRQTHVDFIEIFKNSK